MPLLVVGSVAIDCVETPTASRDDVLGGSAVFFSYAASFFSPVRMIGTVGDDFPAKHTTFLEQRGIDTSGLAPGRHLVYVRARDAAGAVGAVTAGWVTVVALSEVGETEPNNVLTSAQLLPALPLRVNAALPWVRGLPRDIDWFRISVGAGRTATLTMTPGATANYALDVFNASRVRITTGSDGGIGGADVAVFTNTGAAAATYYVRVSAQRQPGATVTGPYTLDLVSD